MGLDQRSPDTARSGLDDHLRAIIHRIGYVAEREFLQLAGVTAGTAETWRKRRYGPAWVRLGNSVFYSLESLADYLKAEQREPRRGAGPGAL